MRAIFKKRNNGRLPGLKRFHDEFSRRRAFPQEKPQTLSRIGHRNRETALISSLSLVRIVQVGQGGFPKKRYRLVLVKVTIWGARHSHHDGDLVRDGYVQAFLSGTPASGAGRRNR
jgi:hypothetical protein